MEAVAEGKPVKQGAAGAELKAGVDVCALLDEIIRVAEEASTGAQVEVPREGSGYIRADAGEASIGPDGEGRKWPDATGGYGAPATDQSVWSGAGSWGSGEELGWADCCRYRRGRQVE